MIHSGYERKHNSRSNLVILKPALPDYGITKKLYKGIRSNRRMSVFLVCLLVSFICWLVVSLNKTYQEQFTFRLNYTNRPFLKNISNDMPKTIVIDIEARGFELIAYSFKQRIDEIDVNVSELTYPLSQTRKTVVVPVRSLLSSQKTGLHSDIAVKHMVPEYLTFDFSPKYRKKVPVIPKVSVSYKKQFYAPFHWIVKPDCVEVSGTREAVEMVRSIQAEPVKLDQVDRKAIIPLTLVKKVQGIEVLPESVWLFVPAEEIAEEKIQLPVEISYGRQENSILLPDKITLVYQASIKDIDKINNDEFRVCVDLSQNTGTYLHKVTICHTPPGVHKAWIENGFVQYLTAR